jgi:hypothetical protein
MVGALMGVSAIYRNARAPLVAPSGMSPFAPCLRRDGMTHDPKNTECNGAGVPDWSHADLARACDFFFEGGEPAKSRLQCTLKGLEQTLPKLIKPNCGHWVLTEEGRKLAKRLHDDETEEVVEGRGGANSREAAPVGAAKSYPM